MMFKQVVSGKKLVILAIIGVLLFGFGLEVYSDYEEDEWGNVPEKWKFELEVSNPKNKKTVDIKGYFWEKKVLKKAAGEAWEEYSDAFKNIQNKLESSLDIKDTALHLVIKQSSDKLFPLDLYKFAFTQGVEQYGLESHFEILAINNTLRIATYWDTGYKDMVQRVHSLRPGVVARGFISLPERLDVNKPFTIWYGGYSAELNAEGLDI